MINGDILRLIRDKGVEIQRLNILGSADRAVGEMDPAKDITLYAYWDARESSKTRIVCVQERTRPIRDGPLPLALDMRNESNGIDG